MTRALLTALFASSVVLANVLAAKLTWVDLPVLGGVAVPAGFVAFGVAYLTSDLIVEFHGRDYGSRVVSVTVGVLAVSWALIWVAIALPTAPFWDGQSAYAATLGDSASVVLASIVALSVAQHADVRLFDRLRQWTSGRHRWLRNCGSTTVTQLLDTIVFIGLAFAVFPPVFGGQALGASALIATVAGQYVVKVGVALVDTPVFYVATAVVDDD